MTRGFFASLVVTGLIFTSGCDSVNKALEGLNQPSSPAAEPEWKQIKSFPQSLTNVFVTLGAPNSGVRYVSVSFAYDNVDNIKDGKPLNERGNTGVTLRTGLDQPGVVQQVGDFSYIFNCLDRDCHEVNIVVEKLTGNILKGRAEILATEIENLRGEKTDRAMARPEEQKDGYATTVSIANSMASSVLKGRTMLVQVNDGKTFFDSELTAPANDLTLGFSGMIGDHSLVNMRKRTISPDGRPSESLTAVWAHVSLVKATRTVIIRPLDYKESPIETLSIGE